MSRPHAPSIGVVVGNPRPGSRTSSVALEVAEQVASTVGGALARVVELGEHGPRVLDPDDPAVIGDVEALARLDVLVVSSPTYKATYTGLLKSFLDRYATGGLSGVTAIPVMVGGGAHHALAAEVHLRPLLVELGAIVPARSLYVIDSELDVLPAKVSIWLTSCTTALRTSVVAAG